MKHVLLYEPAPGAQADAFAHLGEHSARIARFHAAGTLLLIGTLGDPQRDGLLAVFTTREAAEEFAAADPLVLNGVVNSWRVLGWNEVLASP